MCSIRVVGNYVVNRQWAKRIQNHFAEYGLRYRYVLALVAGAFALRCALEPYLADAGFSIFLAAVLIGAWVGGVGPSLLGQTLLLFLHAIVFANRSPAQSEGRAIVGILAYYLVGIVVAVLSDARRVALRRMTAQSERIALQEQELKATVSCIGDAVIVVNRSGQVTLMNPAAQSMTGWQLVEALGQPLDMIFQVWDDARKTQADSHVKSVLQNGTGLREGSIVTLRTRSATQVPVTYNVTPIRAHSEGITGAVVVIRDESDRRSAEEQLREINRRKDDFLATLAHELRNPLAPIRNGLDLLKLSHSDPLVASEVQEIMDRQVRHLIRLVDDLLDVSRISRGKLQLRKSRTSLAKVATTAAQTIKPLIDHAQHQLVLCIPAELAEIDADPDRLTQIACNLLHNAVKFTPSGGRIELRVEEDENETRLIVEDNGSGIHSDKLHAIFEMFNQGADEKEHGKAGLGVGLNLARKLAEMHGGTIEAHSAGINKGSTFRLRLPVRICPSEPPADLNPVQPRSEAPLSKSRVLIVDDNEDALKTMTLMIKTLGHETRTARNGFEALEIADQFRPEFIFMDLGMPVLSGYEAAKRLRELPWGKDMQLIALTGWGQEQDRQRTRDAGFDAHLVKPVELDALRSCFRKDRSNVVEQDGSGSLVTDESLN